MSSANYRDFEIHIRPLEADGVYPVEIRVAAEDLRAEGHFRTPFGDPEIDRVLSFIEEGSVDSAYVQEFGARLFQALFSDQLKVVYDSACHTTGPPLRFRLVLDAPQIARIPWELLYDPGQAAFLALGGPLVRGGSFTAAARPMLVKPPLRILVIDAFPRGVPPLQHQAEAKQIKQALDGLARRGRVEVETLAHATLASLQNALREAVNPASPRPIHMLHIICHGQRDAATGQTTLLFEDETGDIDPVDDQALVNILRPYDIKLVLLNACRSVQAAALDVARGIAPALLAAGVPAVIGMQVSVRDSVARQFARDFYSALADNQPVDSALTEARRLARGTTRYQKADMAIPVCYLRTMSGQIMELEPPERMPLTRATWRLWLRAQLTPRRLVASLLSVITLLSTLLGLYTGAITVFAPTPTPIVFPTSPPPSPTPVPRMTGQLNVVVAEFGGLDEQGHVIAVPAASDLADAVYHQLDGDLKSIGDKASGDTINIQVRGPSQVGRIDGANAEARAHMAEQLAAKIDADVVVYGNLVLGADTTSVQPEFFISTNRLPQASALSGQYELGSSVDIPFNIAKLPFAQGKLREPLLTRTQALTQFVIGLGYYSLDDFERAATYFKAAEGAEGWSAQQARAVLYVFLGNTFISQKNLVEAQKYYQQGYDLNHEYARTRFGLAEVVFQRARADCTAGKADLDQLRRAIDGYNSVLTAKIKPALADVEIKAADGLGRAYLCLSQAGANDHWSDAIDQFKKVIVNYESGNQRVKQLAAEAHGFLGQIYLTIGGGTAEEEYHAAIDLSRYPERQAVFYVWLAFIHNDQRDCAKVDADLALADQLYAKRLRPAPEFEPFRDWMRTQRAKLAC